MAEHLHFKQIEYDVTSFTTFNPSGQETLPCAGERDTTAKNKTCVNLCVFFGTVMCAAHTDLARAQSANNQQVHSESDFFFFFSKNFHSS